MSEHPSVPDLRAYVAGALAQDASESIEQHLDTCEDCTSVVEGLVEGNDSFAMRIRDALKESNKGSDSTVAVAPDGQAPVGDTTLAYSVQTEDGHIRNALGTNGHHLLANAFQPGLVLSDRYSLEEELGRGGMGIVYLANDSRLRRPVAVKVMLPPKLGQSTLDMDHLKSMFEEEARLGANLLHPGIATVFDYGFHDRKPFTVFEYVSGETLRDLLKRRTRLPLEEVRLILATLAQALDFAHAKHVVHRDLKPENIRTTEQGHVKILDLGLAKEFQREANWQFAGTPAYASPEQAGGSPCDGRSDQYALALIVYEMLFGRRVFEEREGGRLLMRHLETPPTIATVDPELPDAVRDALRRALEKDPNKRFARCQDFASALGCDFLSAPFAAPGLLRKDIALHTLAAFYFDPFARCTPGPHPISLIAAFTPGRVWYALLVLDEHSLWVNYRQRVACYPLPSIADVRKLRRGRVVRLTVNTPAGQKRIYFHLRSVDQCLSWCESVRKAVRPEEPHIGPSDIQYTVPIIRGHPNVRLQLLGNAEAQDPKRWVAEATLEVQAAQMGADAIVGLTEEKLPGFHRTERHLTGSLVRTVDATGLRTIGSRWFARQAVILNNWSVLMAIGIFAFLVSPIGVRELQHLSVEFVLASLILVAVPELVPVAMSASLRALKWPQLCYPTAAAFAVSAVPYAVLFLPFGWIIAGIKLFLSGQAIAVAKSISRTIPLSRGQPLMRWVVCGIALTVIAIQAIGMVTWTMMLVEEVYL